MGNTLKDASQENWTTKDEKATHEEIRTGCLQRIATATESMAANYERLRDDRDYWKRRSAEHQIARERLAHVIAGLRGANTKLRKGLRARKA